MAAHINKSLDIHPQLGLKRFVTFGLDKSLHDDV